MLLFVYYDIACKFNYYCNNMSYMHRMQTPDTGPGVQQYMVPEYDIMA